MSERKIITAYEKMDVEIYFKIVGLFLLEKKMFFCSHSIIISEITYIKYSSLTPAGMVSIGGAKLRPMSYL